MSYGRIKLVFGVSLVAAEEKKRALLYKRKLLKRQVHVKKKGRFLYDMLFCFTTEVRKDLSKKCSGYPYKGDEKV